MALHVVLAARTLVDLRERIDLLKNLSGLPKALRIVDPHGHRGHSAEVEVPYGVLADARCRDLRVLKALHEQLKRWALADDCKLVQGMPNDPSSATRRRGRNDGNRDAPDRFAAAYG